jgi:Fe-S oxidoreductase
MMSDSDKNPTEGGLQAPTRHPLGWRDASFWDPVALNSELERVFDICHGCRRCVSLCQSFPTLFDLVDESPTMELDGVDPAEYCKVVDHCYLCDLCYQTKCPYVPPHEWNLDFPHLMLRAKAQQFRAEGAPASRRLLASTQRVGRLATAPGVVKLVNKAAGKPAARKVLEKTLKVHRDAVLPPYARPRLDDRVVDDIEGEAIPARRTRGKVAVFGTCYCQFNRPEIVEDLVAVLRHNGIATRLIRQTECCGMPRLELGDLDTVARYKDINLPLVAKAVAEGWDILTPIPSCTLMFKQELPLMFPEDEQVQTVRAHTFDPFEYLTERHREGLLKTDFRQGLGKVAYHAPCHQRVQNIGPRTRDMLALVPDTEIEMIERCSGHDGTYGVRVETHEHALKIARPVVRRITKAQPDHLSSDCPMATDHLNNGLDGEHESAHPLSLLRKAYGI